MTGHRVIVALSVLAVVGVTYVVASRTYWGDVTVPMPPKGEAATNPYYAAQRLVARLGGRPLRDQLFTPPPADAIVVLSAWNWNLSAPRRAELQAWVESGGRLVLDDTVYGSREFADWSGISYEDRDFEESDEDEPPSCLRFQEERGGTLQSDLNMLCDFDPTTALATSRRVDWALSAPDVGNQAMRVAVGRGSVTLINAHPFTFRQLFNGDHGWLLVRASQFRPGDEVHFLTEADYPSLLSLIWLHGAPVVWLGLGWVALMLWRGGIRMGPLAPADSTVRRSLSEQIRGTGRFALREDEGASLHAATVNALEAAARRRVAGYSGLPPRDRTAALAKAAGVTPEALAHAIHHPGVRRIAEVGGAIALLETVRRDVLRRQTRPQDTKHEHQ
jgi:hypothetical protein